MEKAKNIDCFNIDRCYCTKQIADIELHLFSDASELAYGAVAYLRFTSKTGQMTSILIMSKSKLAHIKTTTVQRLELNAVVMAVRMYRVLVHELDLPIHKSYLWTDLMLVLQYIRNCTKRFKKFVANRVTEILEVTLKEQWGFVPGEQNTADLITSSVSDPEKLMAKDKFGKCWIRGPPFLINENCKLPCQPNLDTVDEDDPEISRKKILTIFRITDEEIIDVERFSKWSKLKRPIGWTVRFVQNCKVGKERSNLKEGPLNLEEINDVVNLLMKQVQRGAYPEELATLRNHPLPIKNKLSSLCPFIDKDGLIRVGGRLKFADLPVEAKQPIILPKSHHVTKLIIRNDHEKKNNIGREHVLLNLRPGNAGVLNTYLS